MGQSARFQKSEGDLLTAERGKRPMYDGSQSTKKKTRVEGSRTWRKKIGGGAGL